MKSSVRSLDKPFSGSPMFALMFTRAPEAKVTIPVVDLIPTTSYNISRFSVELAMNSLIGLFTTMVLAPDIPVLSLK